MADRSQVKRILAGIVQVADGRLEGKTCLYKAFYAAHLYYWHDSIGLLTTHPIVRMPNGPGIAGETRIFRELVTDGLLRIESQRAGPLTESVFLTAPGAPRIKLTPDEERAIKRGLAWVGDNNAKGASDKSHAWSRTWRESKDGEVLPIYLDALNELEVEERQERIDAAKALLDDCFSPEQR